MFLSLFIYDFSATLLVFSAPIKNYSGILKDFFAPVGDCSVFLNVYTAPVYNCTAPLICQTAPNLVKMTSLELIWITTSRILAKAGV